MRDVEVAYQRAGAGPPLVFAHGAAADGRMWQPQLAGLAADFTVVAWDEPGMGRSSNVPDGLVATLILADTYAGWAGSLPEEEVRARVEGLRRMLDADEFDPTLPGLFADGPPSRFAELLEEIAADVRRESLGPQLMVMAETDQRDLLPRVDVPTLLIWGELDERSPLSVARQFEQAIPRSELEVISGSGHVSNLERPEEFNRIVREFCRAWTQTT